MFFPSEVNSDFGSKLKVYCLKIWTKNVISRLKGKKLSFRSAHLYKLWTHICIQRIVEGAQQKKVYLNLTFGFLKRFVLIKYPLTKDRPFKKLVFCQLWDWSINKPISVLAWEPLTLHNSYKLHILPGVGLFL